MGTTDNSAGTKVVAYKITRPDCGGWIHAGTTPRKVAEALKNELDMNEDLPADECGQIVVEAYDTTLEDIEALPEFEGW